ncbi:transcription factor SCREAM2-like [Cocos nucifera]|uniref:Transcription factor SCREAM2-like n=1 Tax=Cocos nucifera TaxID=13894 RepID=A0A8K0I5K6_COCNU|nr:transcription factor SCREAM2-like [Cocos nucifera]
MVSMEQKKAALHDKLQLLRSVTNSHALSKTSIIVDASKYIQELKEKVGAVARDLEEINAFPAVAVETIEKGFLVNVLLEKSFPGLLVSILEAFEELGLDVLDADVSCTNTFRLEAVGGEHQTENMDAQVVRQAVLRAIQKCRE